MANEINKLNKKPLETEGLLYTLRELIQGARQKVLRAVDAVQVQTCWEIGQHIVEFEQRGAARAEYGARLLPILAESLSRDFGKGFDASNLRYMRLFYQAFPIRDALRHELSWTHYRGLSSNGTENLHKGLMRRVHGSSIEAVAGFRSGLSSPRVTASGSVKAYLPSILMCLKLSGERRATSSGRTS
jgi:hypothetical protein